MAGQAAKKADQRVKDFRKQHGGALLVLIAVYAILRFIVFAASWDSMHTYLCVGSVVVMYTCYSWILGHLVAGGNLDPSGGLVDKCRDVLYVNMFAMAGSLLSDHFWWLLLLIPLYATYQMIAMGFKWMMTEKEPEPVEVLSKTQQKKQKKAEKFGYAR